MVSGRGGRGAGPGPGSGPGPGPRGRAGEGWGPGSALTPACRPQDVFLMIRRHKTTIFTDAKESSTVFELKRIVEGILKRPPDEQRLYKTLPSSLLRTTSFWMTARRWASVASPARQHGLRPPPLWG
uniref:Elongin B n=1 Tax=Bos indicus x Bos taurus TaxID=30522 RepID=A0A4W2BP13_BOBOX